MPTGYTSEVADGSITNFADFALLCARAFGATIDMRDEPLDAQIPDEFKPSSYSEKALKVAQERLAEVTSWDVAQATVAARKSYEEATESVERGKQRDAEKRKRYEAMLAAVHEWQPPSDDHRELKNFMVSQLQESVKFDCGYSWPTPESMSGAEFKAKEAAKARKDIEYYARSIAEEYERIRGRNEWVAALRSSLQQPEAN